MAEASCCETHDFCDIEEVHALRRNLLHWYDARKRDLPWRTIVRRSFDHLSPVDIVTEFVLPNPGGNRERFQCEGLRRVGVRGDAAAGTNPCVFIRLNAPFVFNSLHPIGNL